MTDWRDQWTFFSEYLREVVDETDSYVEFRIHLRPDPAGPYLIRSNDTGSPATWAIEIIKEPK